ncbi:helix-turn-helix transcriptional regulator [Enterobacter sp.]|uniref:helix-turn-helix transcriptional regulator n=1 Tax=Enterobacter sp. TaxID=42895 RepID=UPI00296EE078|nr:WYL domain-containing protein [Enterobacter sp.]
MENKHQLLATRLGEILGRFNNGETLYVNQLAEEYGVHPRTIKRDILERLSFLDIEPQAERGGYKIAPGLLGRFDANSIDLFARLAGVSELFPGFNKRMLSSMHSATASQTITVHGHRYIDSELQAVHFSRLQRAIDEHCCVNFRYLRRNEERRYAVEPYQLTNLNGIWYLAARHENRMKNFTLTKITALDCTFETFEPDGELLAKMRQEPSVWGVEDKFSVTLSVAPEVAEYFQRRDLLNEQVIEQQTADGGLIVTTQVAHKKEILPVVQYWIPHLKILAPASLQSEMEAEIKSWLTA